MTGQTAIGYYGKVPTKGDFVGRGLPRTFVDPWDQWLQAAIDASRRQLGGRWLDIYLTSPVWRFVLSPGICGNGAGAGVMIPSVDRVGRYFPLVVGATIPGDVILATLPVLAGDWFDAVETTALMALDEGVDFSAFDARVSSITPPTQYRSDGVAAVENGTRLPLAAGGRPLTAYPAALHRVLAETGSGSYALWWTAGSDRVAGSLLIMRSLPQPTRFSALLDGGWMRWGWTSGDQATQPVMPAS